MTSLEVKRIYHRLDKEIIHLTKSALIIHKEAGKEDAQQVLSTLKIHLDVWIPQLDEKKLTLPQLEFLVFQKRNQIKMDALKNIGVSKIEMDLFKHCLLRLVVNTIINSMWKRQLLDENERRIYVNQETNN